MGLRRKKQDIPRNCFYLAAARCCLMHHPFSQASSPLRHWRCDHFPSRSFHSQLSLVEKVDWIVGIGVGSSAPLPSLRMYAPTLYYQEGYELCMVGFGERKWNSSSSFPSFVWWNRVSKSQFSIRFLQVHNQPNQSENSNPLLTDCPSTTGLDQSSSKEKKISYFHHFILYVYGSW